MSPPQKQPGPTASGFGQLVTNLARLAGIVIAVNDSLLRADPRPQALAVAALLFAGAQGVDSLLDRLFGK